MSSTFNDLRWDEHVTDVFRRASKRIFAIRNLKRSGCDTHSIIKVYRQTIQSILAYCHPCCCNMCQFCFKTLLKIEKRALNIIFQNCKRSPDDIVTLPIAIQRSCVRLFQNVADNIKHPLRSFFDKRRPTPRNKSTLKRPRCKTVRFKNSFIKYCS